MKLIIAGGRNNYLKMADCDRLDEVVHKNNVTEIVSGGAKGIDRSGELYAERRGILLEVIPANWDDIGGSAGNVRNEAMAIYADAVALFIGGKGTQDMYERAIKHNLKIFDFRIHEN